MGQLILVGGTLLKKEVIEDDAEGVDGVPVTSTFFVVSFFFLFLLSDRLTRDLLIPEDIASAITKLHSGYMAQTTPFRPYFFILYCFKKAFLGFSFSIWNPLTCFEKEKYIE